MGIYDRDYHQAPPRQRSGLALLLPVVKWLLITNVSIFLLDYLLIPLVLNTPVEMQTRPPVIFSWGCFTIQSAIHEFRIWEFITFQFLHGGFFHVLFNSIAIYFFGPWMERYLGSLKFLIYYLLCGAAGAAFFTLLATVGILPNAGEASLVGASAGIYGIFIGIAILAPNMRVMLVFPPIELSMRQLAIALLGIATAVILFDLKNAGGEAGHLGGAILGFFLMKFPRLLGMPSKTTIHSTPDSHNRFQSKLSQRSRSDLEQDTEVDAILDKVSREGFQSLTEKEKETLQRAANRHNPSSNP